MAESQVAPVGSEKLGGVGVWVPAAVPDPPKRVPSFVRPGAVAADVDLAPGGSGPGGRVVDFVGWFVVAGWVAAEVAGGVLTGRGSGQDREFVVGVQGDAGIGGGGGWQGVVRGRLFVLP